MIRKAGGAAAGCGRKRQSSRPRWRAAYCRAWRLPHGGSHANQLPMAGIGAPAGFDLCKRWRDAVASVVRFPSAKTARNRGCEPSRKGASGRRTQRRRGPAHVRPAQPDGSSRKIANRGHPRGRRPLPEDKKERRDKPGVGKKGLASLTSSCRSFSSCPSSWTCPSLAAASSRCSWARRNGIPRSSSAPGCASPPGGCRSCTTAPRPV